MSVASITPKELHALQQQGKAIDLLDVRSRSEYRSVHAEGARLIPLGSLDPSTVMNGRTLPPEEPIYVICQSGGRSRQACSLLIQAGITNVVNVEGGTAAWERAGLPVVRETGSSSAGRSLKTLAMLLVFVGLFLGLTVNQWFTFGAAAIWVGLIATGNGPCCGTSCNR